MRQYSTKSGIPAGNPIANILVIIAGALVIGASIVLGFFAFIILAAVVLVAAAVIGIRVWWLNRKIARGEMGSAERKTTSARIDVIEGEYEVVDSERDEA